MFPILQTAQVRRDHAADRAAVGRAVGVAADVLEDGADVEARAAADAVEGVALFRISEQLGAAVVEQHDVVFLRTVAFARLARTAVHRVVAGEGLAGTGGREHRQEERQVLQLRQHLLDADQRDQRLRQRGGEAGVALVLRYGDHARLGDGEVRAGDAHIGRDVFPAKRAAGDHRELFRLPGGRAAELLLEQLVDVVAGEVHRREDDVVGRLVAELDDELAEIRFDHLVAGLLHRVVEMDLLGGHRHGAGALRLDDAEDDLAGLGGVARPMDLGAARLHLVGEFGEIGVEVVDGVPLRLRGRLAGRLPIVEGGLLPVARGLVFAQRGLDQPAMAQVAGDDPGLGEEILDVRGHRCARISARWRVLIGLPWRLSRPCTCMRQLESFDTM